MVDYVTKIDIVYDRLKDVAKSKRTISYSELNEQCDLEFNLNLDSERNKLARILDYISIREVSAKKPMLSVVVIAKDKGMPGDGFFKCASMLGRWNEGETKETVYKRELDACYARWS